MKPAMTVQDWSDVVRYSRRDLEEAIKDGANATEQRFLRAGVAYAEDKRSNLAAGSTPTGVAGPARKTGPASR